MFYQLLTNSSILRVTSHNLFHHKLWDVDVELAARFNQYESQVRILMTDEEFAAPHRLVYMKKYGREIQLTSKHTKVI